MSSTDQDPAERRTETRFDAYIKVSISKDVETLKANNCDHIDVSHTLDVSLNGLQVMLEEELISGNDYALAIETYPNHEHIYLTAHVKWALHRQAEDIYLAGLIIKEHPENEFTRWKEFIEDIRVEQEEGLDPDDLDLLISDLLD